MKQYIITFLAAALSAALCEAILPEGSIKKYAASIIGIILTGMLIIPLFGTDIEEIIPKFYVDFEQEAQEKILAEAEKTAESRISTIEGIKSKVSIAPDGRIEKVILYGKSGNDTVKFITQELGVSRYDIKIE